MSTIRPPEDDDITEASKPEDRTVWCNTCRRQLAYAEEINGWLCLEDGFFLDDHQV